MMTKCGAGVVLVNTTPCIYRPVFSFRSHAEVFERFHQDLSSSNGNEKYAALAKRMENEVILYSPDMRIT